MVGMNALRSATRRNEVPVSVASLQSCHSAGATSQWSATPDAATPRRRVLPPPRSKPGRMRHFVRMLALSTVFALSLAAGSERVLAQRAGVQSSGGEPTAYEAFVKDAQAQRGLFTIWHKAGRVYLELAADQLDHEFVQTIVPSTGLGGFGLVWGNTDHLPTELVRFERAGNNVAILWPSPYFIAPRTPAAQRAIDRSFARSSVSRRSSPSTNAAGPS